MPKEIPHVVHIDSTSITASSSKTDTIEIGSNEIIEIIEIRVISATGTYTMEITDQGGFAYQNEAYSQPAVGSAPNEYNIYKLPMPLVMTRSTKFSFKFTDTSASTNRVKLLLICKRTLD